jgi:hypothetical protein
LERNLTASRSRTVTEDSDFKVNKRLEGGLTDGQKEQAKGIALEIFSRTLQTQAPEPTTLMEYKDVYELTQAPSFVEWQERILSAPMGVMHPGHRILACLIQMENADLTLRAAMGYLQQARDAMKVAQTNAKGACYAVLKTLNGSPMSLIGQDKEGREWQVFTSAASPDSVVLRLARKGKLDERKKRGRPPAKRAAKATSSRNREIYKRITGESPD